MSAPPSVVSPVADPADIELDSATGYAPVRTDDNEARPDPAASVVAIGDVPPLVKPRRARRTVLPPMPTDRARGWIVTLIITAIGAAVRLVGLGNSTDGGTPLFDEKYYAIQAQEILRNGGVEDNQGFGVVVHPPFGKQLIAIGEWLLGYTPTGWRLASAVAGIVSILLIIRVVRRMTRSTLLGGIAGVLLICDGVSHVQSRSALLDIFQAVFVLGAFACMIADRDQVRARLAAAVADGSIATSWAGVALGARWWRFGAGVLLGLTTAVKWSGAYWIVAFGVLTVIWDITARREAGIRTTGPGRGPPGPRAEPVGARRRPDAHLHRHLVGLVRVRDRLAAAHLVAVESNRSDWKSGALYDLASIWSNELWQWTWKMLDFHSHLLTPTDPAKRHPWESKPWTWPLGTRPVLYYSPANGTGCGDGRTDCVRRIFLIGTPALWWISLFVLVWALWKAIGRMDWRYAAVLVGYGAGYLPWFTNLDRQMYFFYATPLAPFLVIGITLVLGDILGRAVRRGGKTADVGRRRRDLRRAGGRELHLAVADPERRPDHPGAADHGDLAAVLGVGPESRSVPACSTAAADDAACRQFGRRWPG